MAKRIDNDNDDATVPETAYQDADKTLSSKATSLSSWGLLIAVLFIVAIGVFVFSRSGSHTDPAPNGGVGNGGATGQPAPTQNSQ